MRIGWAVVLAVGLIIGAFAYGGVYQMVVSKEGFVYRMNRFTGATELCVGARCEPVP